MTAYRIGILPFSSLVTRSTPRRAEEVGSGSNALSSDLPLGTGIRRP